MKETADFLRLPLSSVYCLVQRGKIPAIQIGGRLRIKKASLDGHVFHRAKPGRPTVLLVEEDRGLRELFRTLLKKIGFGRVDTRSDSSSGSGYVSEKTVEGRAV